MASPPIDFFYATAPGYSFVGSYIWPRGEHIFTKFMNACAAYESAARASLSAQLEEGWVPTGETYSGTAAPAIPAEEFSYAACGSGQRNTQALIGNTGITTVQIDFYSKKLKKEYRWVEDSPYTPEGNVELTAIDNPINECSDPPHPFITTVLDELRSAVMGFSGTESELVAFVSDLSPSFVRPDLWYTMPSCNDFRLLGGCGINENKQICLSIQIAGNSSLWHPVASYIVNTGSDGEWHLEGRYSLDSPAQKCGTAYYMKAPFDLSSGNAGAPRAKFISRLSYSMPSGEGNGTMQLGTHCNTSTYTTGADIWDPFVVDGSTLLPEGYVIEGEYHPAVEWSFTTPGGPVAIQQGTPLLGYNTSNGAFVYDMDLKKWGKWNQLSSALVEFTGLKSGFSYTDLGMTAGLLHADGLIYLFDHQPADSWIRYGKMGYYRLGMVHFLEGRIDFRDYATGSVEIDFSMDGRNIDSTLQQVYNYNAVLSYKMYPNQRSRWSTIKISGNYDLQYMEVRGNISCRR